MRNREIVFYKSGELEGSPYQEAVWQLLCRYADAFVPPLNQRSGTTQQDLTPGGFADDLPTAYFASLKQQNFLLMLDDGQLAGFLSFRTDYAADVLADRTPCAYVSTILVREESRRTGITTALYQELLKGTCHENAYVSTRTWSENRSHIGLLRKLGFDLTLCIPNDRGEGIDTVYFRKAVTRSEASSGPSLSLWEKFKAYKLNTNIYAVAGMAAISALFIGIYLFPQDSTFIPELALAFATSLLASIFCILAELFINYRARQDDKLLEGLQAFGILNLHFDKQTLVTDLLKDCCNDLWISGYRLILTRKITPWITERIRTQKKLQIRVLLCPPWTDSYQHIYGGDDHVMDNYISFLRSVQNAYGSSPVQCQVHFVEKPLFNDTYKFDKYIVTGPYLHAKISDGGRITANDFFTYEVARKSRLQELMEKEYATLWDESVAVLDWDAFRRICRTYSPSMTEAEKEELLRSACRPIGTEQLLLPDVEMDYAQ